MNVYGALVDRFLKGKPEVLGEIINTAFVVGE